MNLERIPEFASKYVPKRRVDIWLPPGYDPQTNIRYPVIYMHDGQNLFEPEHAFIGVDWGIDEALRELIAEDAIHPPIVVGIWNTENRLGEYMPERALNQQSDRERMEKLIAKFPGEFVYKLKGDAYLAFIVEELKPWVDSHYLSLADQSNTFIMGSSMGGLISLYALCRYPDAFSGAGCLSNAWNIGEDTMLSYFQHNLPDPVNHKIYLDMGGRESWLPFINYLVRAHRKMTQQVQDKGYRHNQNLLSKIFLGDKHSEVYWRKRVQLPLRFFLQA